PETGLAVRPFPQTEEVTAGRAASGGLPTRQVGAEDGPRPSRPLVADATPRSHFVGWGVLAISAGIGGPRSLQHRSPPADTAGRAVWCWLLGLPRPQRGRLCRPGPPPPLTSRRTRRLGPLQVSGSQPPGSR